MEPNNNTGDLEFFISYIRRELSAKCSTGSAVSLMILGDLLERLAAGFASDPDISFICRETLDETAEMLAKYLDQILQVVENDEEWAKYRDHFLADTAKYIPA